MHCFLTGLLLVASVATAQQPTEPPAFAAGGGPPSIGVVDGVKDGKLIFRQTQYAVIPKTRMREVDQTVVVDGKNVTRREKVPETYTEMKRVSVTTMYDLADVRAFDTDAKPIPADRLPGLFARPSIVLFSLAGPAVDPAFL